MCKSGHLPRKKKLGCMCNHWNLLLQFRVACATIVHVIVFCTCSICFTHQLHVQLFFLTCNVQIQNDCTCSWDWIAHAGAMFCLHEQASRAVAARAKPCVLFIFLVSPATRMKLPREKSVRSKKVPNRKGRRFFFTSVKIYLGRGTTR